jgi:hypothetical protein
MAKFKAGDKIQYKYKTYEPMIVKFVSDDMDPVYLTNSYGKNAIYSQNYIDENYELIPVEIEVGKEYIDIFDATCSYLCLAKFKSSCLAKFKSSQDVNVIAYDKFVDDEPYGFGCVGETSFRKAVGI